MPASLSTRLAGSLGSAPVHWIALLGLCAAYLQGGYNKLTDFPAAVAEMQHFGLQPAAPLAAAVIALELGAAAMVLSGKWRWIGALVLAGFTLGATLVANRYWNAPLEARFALANAFYEHLGLVGGFLLVSCQDVRERTRRKPHDQQAR